MTLLKSEEINKKKQMNLKNQRDRDREIVRGIFKFDEVPGGTMSFVYKKYREDPVERYSFVDGCAYSIPLGVAKHLNKNGKILLLISSLTPFDRIKKFGVKILAKKKLPMFEELILLEIC